jgi:hypothetical protein
MSDQIEDNLKSAATGIRDDIRGLFARNPDYRDYLVKLLRNAAKEIEDLREQLPAPSPEALR